MTQAPTQNLWGSREHFQPLYKLKKYDQGDGSKPFWSAHTHNIILQCSQQLLHPFLKVIAINATKPFLFFERGAGDEARSGGYM